MINKEMPENYRKILRKFPGLLDHTVIEKSDESLEILLQEELITALNKPEIAFDGDPLNKSFLRIWEIMTNEKWTLKAFSIKLKEIWEKDDTYFKDLRWLAKRPENTGFNSELEEKLDVEIDEFGFEKHEEELIAQDVLASTKSSIFNEIDKNIIIKNLEDKIKKLESENQNLKIELKALKQI